MMHNQSLKFLCAASWLRVKTAPLHGYSIWRELLHPSCHYNTKLGPCPQQHLWAITIFSAPHFLQHYTFLLLENKDYYRGWQNIG